MVVVVVIIMVVVKVYKYEEVSRIVLCQTQKWPMVVIDARAAQNHTG